MRVLSPQSWGFRHSSTAEEVMVSRDILIAEFTGTPVHIAHVSTMGSVRLIRDAKARGVRVTAETAPTTSL